MAQPVRMRHGLALAAAFAVFVLTAGGGSAQQGEIVPIRASTDGSAATMVFEWSSDVDYQTRLVGQTLVVNFSRPLMPRFSEVFTTLRDVVESVGATDGGLSVTFTLAEPYQLADRKDGTNVVIDLAPREALAQTPLPQPAQTAAPQPTTNPSPPDESLAPVTVRFDADDTISRASFGWTRDAGYRVERSGDQVVIRFDRPGRLVGDTSAPPRPFFGLAQVQTQPTLVVSLNVDDQVAVRDYRNAFTIIVDAIAPDGAAAPLADASSRGAAPVQPAPSEPVEAAATPAVAETEPAAEAADLPFVSAIPTTADSRTDPAPSETSAPSPTPEPAVTAEAQVADVPPEPTAPETASPQAAEEAPETVTEIAETGPVEAGPTDVAEPSPAAPAVAAESEEIDASAPSVTPSPINPDREAVASAAPAPSEADEPVAQTTEEPSAEEPMAETDAAPQAVPVAADEFDDEGDILVGFDIRANGLDLTFPWPSEVAAAVFQRAGHTWVLFDSPADFNFRLFSDDLPVVAGVEQVSVPGHALARFELTGRYRPKVRVENMTWVVSLGASGGPTQPLEVISEPAAEIGPRLLVLDETAGTEISLIDPTVGDPLFVVPVGAVGHGVARARRLIDLEILETAQGVAVRPIADTIAVRSLRQGVEITNLAGLNIGATPTIDEDDEPEGPLTPAPVTRNPSTVHSGIKDGESSDSEFLSDGSAVFDFAAWRDPSNEGYLKSKHELQLALGAADAAQRAERRLDLAKFHFANVEAAETLGWIQNALAEAPWLEEETTVRALRGAANLRLGRLEEARTDLFDPGLDFTKEARHWRGAYFAENGDMGAASQAFVEAGALPEDYPEPIAREFRFLSAEAAARAGRVDRSHDLLDGLAAELPRKDVQDRIDYIRGLARLASGETERALGLFSSAAGSNDRQVRAKAQRERLELTLAEGLSTPDEVIDGLDALRFVWRGDNFELDLMQRMAELYLDQKKFAAGLGVYRQAISIFPDSPDVRVIANIMNDTYKDLFLGDRADTLAPLEALALYYDFRELTPVGAVGDQMIFRLADRLVEVDLLDQAAAVLQHQVDFRLRGNELAKVGARLAEIYMLDQKPDVAVRALRASAVPSMPEAISDHRNDLMVRALTAVGEYQQALDLLRGQTGREADRLRARIYWRQQNWLSAATASARLLEDWVPGEFLTTEESDDLMRLAVSLAMTNNRSALAKLRDDYGELIQQTPRARAFNAISSYVDAGPLDADALSEAAEEIGSYEDFLSALRETVATDKLAAAE